MSRLPHSDFAAVARMEPTVETHPAAVAAAERAASRAPLRLMRSAKRVLVVDDHPSVRRITRKLLADDGFEIVGEADHGAAALALADDLVSDLVLLDIQLPDVDGFEVASRLLERHPRLAIVLVSVRDRSDYGSLIEQSGARGFVSKADLSGVIVRRLLDSQHA